MDQTLKNTGDPNNVIIVGAGSEESVERSEVNSGIDEIISSSVSRFIIHLVNQRFHRKFTLMD